MKDLTQDEKVIILNALNCYWREINHSCMILTGEGKDELRRYQKKIDELHKRYLDEVHARNVLETHKIVVKYNNTSMKETCPICGEPFRSDTPVEAFLDDYGYDYPVCRECTEKYAPELFKEMEEKYQTWLKEMKES